jgi:hypothetical protein
VRAQELTGTFESLGAFIPRSLLRGVFVELNFYLAVCHFRELRIGQLANLRIVVPNRIASDDLNLISV